MLTFIFYFNKVKNELRTGDTIFQLIMQHFHVRGLTNTVKILEQESGIKCITEK